MSHMCNQCIFVLYVSFKLWLAAYSLLGFDTASGRQVEAQPLCSTFCVAKIAFISYQLCQEHLYVSCPHVKELSTDLSVLMIQCTLLLTSFIATRVFLSYLANIWCSCSHLHFLSCIRVRIKTSFLILRLMSVRGGIKCPPQQKELFFPLWNSFEYYVAILLSEMQRPVCLVWGH